MPHPPCPARPSSLHCNVFKAMSYYNENQVSLHTIYTWTTEGNSSIIAMSDDTDHGAAEIYASLELILKSFFEAGKKAITLISNSLLPQYGNK